MLRDKIETKFNQLDKKTIKQLMTKFDIKIK